MPPVSAKRKIVTRTKQPPINPAAAMEVLKADVSKLPAYVGVDLPGTGLRRVPHRQGGAGGQRRMKRAASRSYEQITGALGQQDMYNYVEVLKQKAKAKVLAKVWWRKRRPSKLVPTDQKTRPRKRTGSFFACLIGLLEPPRAWVPAYLWIDRFGDIMDFFR